MVIPRHDASWLDDESASGHLFRSVASVRKKKKQRKTKIRSNSTISSDNLVTRLVISLVDDTNRDRFVPRSSP